MFLISEKSEARVLKKVVLKKKKECIRNHRSHTVCKLTFMVVYLFSERVLSKPIVIVEMQILDFSYIDA